jgi:hypothetical protein
MMHLRCLLLGLTPLVVGFLASCSATTDRVGLGGGGDGNGQGGASSSGSGEGGGLFGDGGIQGSGGGLPTGCSDEAKLVYIIGSDNRFYSFYPPTLDVSLKGVLKCPAPFATPFSMAVDRSGIAWVLFSNGKIYHVDVKTVACTATSYVANQAGFTRFGMGFVSNSPGSADETLYVADYNGKGLAKIDTTTLQLTPIGPWDQFPPIAAEFTGTGDARLYGFFNVTPINIAEIDKQSGKVISQAPQPTIKIGSGWAFAFWGGDFWLFTSPSGSTQIDRYSPAMGTTMTVKTSLGTNIVGAGVSTCAPVEPPK